MSSTTTSLLEVEGLTAGYFDADVIRGLSLTVGGGEVVSLLGANGAGKTTTLRALSRIIPVTAGTVTLSGERIDGLKPQRVAQLGLVHMSERRGIFHGLTVEEHFRLHGLDAALGYAHFPELERLRGCKAGLLSGGEQQMLGLARALARKPAVLMVDELSKGLAPVIVQRIVPVLRAYADETGAGVLLVEQQIQMALQVSDRAYVLVHGEVAQHDTAESMRANRELIVSSYLGSADD